MSARRFVALPLFCVVGVVPRPGRDAFAWPPLPCPGHFDHLLCRYRHLLPPICTVPTFVGACGIVRFILLTTSFDVRLYHHLHFAAHHRCCAAHFVHFTTATLYHITFCTFCLLRCWRPFAGVT